MVTRPHRNPQTPTLAQPNLKEQLTTPVSTSHHVNKHEHSTPVMIKPDVIQFSLLANAVFSFSFVCFSLQATRPNVVQFSLLVNSPISFSLVQFSLGCMKLKVIQFSLLANSNIFIQFDLFQFGRPKTKCHLVQFINKSNKTKCHLVLFISGPTLIRS